MRMIVDKDKCPQDHRCPAIAICPQQAISQKSNYSLPEIDEQLCTMCGKCIKYCPKGAFIKQIS